MRLTRYLLAYVRRKHVPGQLYAGKHQMLKPVSMTHKKQAVDQLIMEQENLDLLTKPYLTEEEDYGHMKELKRQEYQMLIVKQKEDRWLETRSMDEYLDHLNVDKKWE